MDPLLTTDLAEVPISGTSHIESFARPASKAERFETRRKNLIMLTQFRGAKAALTLLAGLSNGRISLMTSDRKPMSDPFATAIETSLGLPTGWLDVAQPRGAVPPAVWQLLGNGAPSVSRASASSAVITAHAMQARTTATAIARPGSPEAACRNTRDIPGLSRRSRKILLAQPAEDPPCLFEKPAGTVGPIAEALARTLINLSRADKLSERKAFQLLDLLLSNPDP